MRFLSITKNHVHPWLFDGFPPGFSMVIRSRLSPMRTVQRRTRPVRKSCHCKQPKASPVRRGRFSISISASARWSMSNMRRSACAFCDAIPIFRPRSDDRARLCCHRFRVMGGLITCCMHCVRSFHQRIASAIHWLSESHSAEFFREECAPRLVAAQCIQLFPQFGR